MAVLFYFSVGIENKSSTWWGANGEHCELASCPTAKGKIVDDCPETNFVALLMQVSSECDHDALTESH